MFGKGQTVKTPTGHFAVVVEIKGDVVFVVTDDWIKMEYHQRDLQTV